MTQRRNVTLALNMAALATAMLLLAFASVPLYRLFCEVTGYGGTPKQVDAAPGKSFDRVMTVRFNADINDHLPWEFKPGEKEVTLKVGEERLSFFTAKNLTNKPIKGHATYNVVPVKAGPYFAKIECFCFQTQTLAANESVHMPVSFFIDPSIMDDPGMKDVKTITLSYTFFPATSEER